MKVYQLRLVKEDMVLEPVFENTHSLRMYQNKYIGRKMEILTKDISCSEYVYRILNVDEDGEYLDDNIYSSYEEAMSSIIGDSKVVKENIVNESKLSFTLEVM